MKTKRTDVEAARRIVVKVGSSSLTTLDGALAVDRLDLLVNSLAARAVDTEIVLVSSGAIAAGLAPLGFTKRPTDLPSQQAAASVGQSRLMAHYTTAFEKHGRTVGQVLLTAEDITRRNHYNNAQKALNRLLDLDIIPIVNENDTVATNEIKFGDNDRLAALVALLVQADALLLLSDVDGLYDGHPITGAKLISNVESLEQLAGIEISGAGSSIGSGGMVTKVEAAMIAASAGIPVVLTSAAQVEQALAAENVGTYFKPAANRPASRMMWLAHGTVTRGTLHLDAGAVGAVLNRGSSLLAAGVTGFSGDFNAGDAVELLDSTGAAIARGLVTFDSAELTDVIGKSTKELAEKFGPDYERELVHRDDLVVLQPRG
jgi:glutamate 5-kinase